MVLFNGELVYVQESFKPNSILQQLWGAMHKLYDPKVKS